MANKQEPVLLELAHLPREQMGPFLLLGLDKDASKEDIEAHWAERLKWARKQQWTVTLEEINWARETISDPARRIGADVASLNADTANGLIAQLVRRYGGGDDQGPAWEPMDEEKPLADYELAADVPDAAAVREAIVLPEVPQELPGAARLLEQLARSPLDPWAIQL
jgi:hypothetical protein